MMQTSFRPAGHDRRPAHRSRGFTLVELLVVLLVAGILAFAAMGRLADVATVQLDGFGEDVASALRMAQKAAIAQRRLVYVQVSASQLAACLDAACTQTLAQPAGGKLSLGTPSGLSMASNAAQFTFDGMGRPSFTTPLSIVVATSQGLTTTITVQVDSGYVQRS
jgi:MSHA pilin protein MshC